MSFLVIGSTGRLLGIILETLGGNYVRHAQYQKIFVLVGVVLFIVLGAVVFRKSFGNLFGLIYSAKPETEIKNN